MNNLKKNSNELLSIKDLTIAYDRSDNAAVNQANFSVNKGDFFGIVGESGSGKTSLGKAVIRLVNPSSGEINIDGRIISNKKISRANKRWLTQSVQMIFQNPSGSMNPIRTVLQTVSEPLTTNPALVKEAIKYIYTIQSIRKYCKYEFSMKQFELYWAFQMDYLSRLRDKYTMLLTKLKAIAIESKRPDQELYEELELSLQNFTEDRLKDINDVYAFANSNRNIADEQISRCTKGQLGSMDLALRDAIKQKQICKLNARYSFVAQRKRNDICKLKARIEALKTKFHKEKTDTVQVVLDRWKSALKAKAEKYDSLTKLAKDDFVLVNNQIELLKQKHLLCYWKIIHKFKALHPTRLEKTISFIEKRIDETYAPLVADIARYQNAFQQGHADLSKVFYWIKIFKIMARQIRHHFIFNFSSKAVNIAPIIAENLNSQGSINKHHPFDPQDFYFITRTNYEKINQAIEQLKNSETEIIKKLCQRVAKLEDQLKAWKNELKKINKNRNLFEEIKAKWLFIKSKRQLRQIKKKRRNYFKNVYMNKWKMFCNNKDKVKLKIDELAQKVFCLHIECVKKAKAIAKSIQHRELDDQEKKSKSLGNNTLYQNIILKLNRINSLNNEYNALVKDTHLYWRLFRWKLFFPWLLLGKIVHKKMQERVFEMLKLVGLRYEYAFRYPHEFSGGQKQRIVIARALIANPKLLIADEPISALDVSIQAQIINVMNKLNKKLGVTFLFIAHDLSVVRYVCNKIIIMHHGRTLERGDTNEIFSNPVHPYTRSLLAAAPKLSRIHVDLSSFSEKFDYTQDYSIKNMPTFNKVPGDTNHEVFSTPSQFAEWCNTQTKE